MTLGNDMIVVGFWHLVGHHVPADMPPRFVQMQCRGHC